MHLAMSDVKHHLLDSISAGVITTKEELNASFTQFLEHLRDKAAAARVSPEVWDDSMKRFEETVRKPVADRLDSLGGNGSVGAVRPNSVMGQNVYHQQQQPIHRPHHIPPVIPTGSVPASSSSNICAREGCGWKKMKGSDCCSKKCERKMAASKY
jgi:hypothetical protein